MTKTEASLVVAFLDHLSERFSCDGCNDTYLPDTPQMRQIVEAAEKANRTESERAEWELGVGEGRHQGQLCTYNVAVVDWLRDRLVKEHGLKEQEVPEV